MITTAVTFAFHIHEVPCSNPGAVIFVQTHLGLEILILPTIGMRPKGILYSTRIGYRKDSIYILNW